MKLRFLLVAALVLAPVPAAAAFQSGRVVFIGIGATLPTGTDAAFYDAGFNVGVAIDLPLTEGLILQGAASYHRLRLDHEGILRSIRFEGTGDGLTGGIRSGIALLGNVKVLLPASGSAAEPYLFGGAGLGSFSNVVLYGVDVSGCRRDWETVPGEPRTELALNVGGGLTIAVGRGISLFAQGLYLVVLGEDTSARLVPVQIGWSFVPGLVNGSDR